MITNSKSPFEELKEAFKRETKMDADKNIEVYIQYVQAKALLALNANLGFMSEAVQVIRNNTDKLKR